MSDGVVHHQLDVYGVWLHVTRSKKAWRALRDTPGIDVPKKIQSLGLTTRVSERDGTMHFAVYLHRDLEGAGLVEITAHEAAHLAGLLLDAVGQPYNGESESFAYLVGWATSWLWQVARGLENTAS